MLDKALLPGDDGHMPHLRRSVRHSPHSLETHMRLILRPMRHSSFRSPNMSSASHGMTWMKELVGGGSGRRMGGTSGWLVEGDESPPSLLLSTRRCHASAEEVPGVEGLADAKAVRVRYLWTMRLRLGNAATPALSKRYARPRPTTLPGSSDIQNAMYTMCLSQIPPLWLACF